MPQSTADLKPSYDDDYDVLAGRLSAMRRHHPEQDHTELATHLRTMRLARQIRRALDQAPPLSKKQRADLSRLLRDYGQEVQ